MPDLVARILLAHYHGNEQELTDLVNADPGRTVGALIGAVRALAEDAYGGPEQVRQALTLIALDADMDTTP